MADKPKLVTPPSKKGKGVPVAQLGKDYTIVDLAENVRGELKAIMTVGRERTEKKSSFTKEFFQLVEGGFDNIVTALLNMVQNYTTIASNGLMKDERMVALANQIEKEENRTRDEIARTEGERERNEQLRKEIETLQKKLMEKTSSTDGIVRAMEAKMEDILQRNRLEYLPQDRLYSEVVGSGIEQEVHTVVVEVMEGTAEVEIKQIIKKIGIDNELGKLNDVGVSRDGRRLFLKSGNKDLIERYKDKLESCELFTNRATARFVKDEKNKFVLLGVPGKAVPMDIKAEIMDRQEYSHSQIEVIYMGEENRFGKKTVIIEVDVTTRLRFLKHLEEDKNLIFIIDMERCRVVPYKRIIRCFKCQGFGHTIGGCREKTPKCCDCAGEHDSRSCKEQLSEENKCCINCNTKGHSARSKRCPKFIEYRRNLFKS